MTEIMVDIGDVELPPGTVRAVWREVKDGEKFLIDCTGPTHIDSYPNTLAMVGTKRIVFEQWQWPEFIKGGWWIAMDEDKGWGLFSERPYMDMKQDGWFVDSGQVVFMSAINWTPPPCSDWTKSLMQKPRSK